MPVYVQQCVLRADGPIYYATREVGRLYETGDHLHNYALTYALGLAQSAYHVDSLQPSYQEHLSEVSARGIYVTPGTPRRITHMISSLKFGKETWHEDPGAKKTGNYPRYGRVKEIAPNSEFVFHVLSPAPIPLPRWVRVGIWMTKCEITIEAAGQISEAAPPLQPIVATALNPLDLTTEASAFDIIPMPPNSLIRFAVMSGAWLRGKVPDGRGQQVSIDLPAGMRYLAQVNP
jgi:CRISPR-associated protein Csc1